MWRIKRFPLDLATKRLVLLILWDEQILVLLYANKGFNKVINDEAISLKTQCGTYSMYSINIWEGRNGGREGDE